MDERHTQVELLAPASGMEAIRLAVCAGADAVYTGGSRFGARAYANNLDDRQLKEAIDFVHLHGKRLYLTVNTLLKEKELKEELVPFLMPYYKQGLDAVIVQDIGVLRMIRKVFPKLPIHVSTQAVVTGAGSAREYEKLGASRIVTARELSLEEIKAIRKEITIEIESFVHGALCYCYSGQCLFSSFIGGRSGNRGRCAQPCRLPYELYDEKKNKMNEEQEKYLLSPKDICTLDILPDILKAGVFSLKIEGRMKRAEYMAGVTAIYRKYIDLYLEKGREGYVIDEQDRRDLMDLYNRGGFHAGYYTKHNGKDMMALKRPNHNGVYAGALLSKKNGYFMQAKVALHKKDVLEFQGIWDKKNKKELELICTSDVDKGKTYHLPEKYNFLFSGQKKPVDVYRTKNEALLQEILHKYEGRAAKIPLHGKVRIAAGEPVSLALSYFIKKENAKPCEENEIHCVQKTKECAQIADKQPIREEEAKKQLTKTGDSEFLFETFSVEMEGDCFVPIKVLNQLRRDALLAMQQAILRHYQRIEPIQKGSALSLKMQLPSEKEGAKENGLQTAKCQSCVMVETIEQLEVVLRYPQIDRMYVSVHAFTQQVVWKKEQGQETFKGHKRESGFVQLKHAIKQCHEQGKQFYLVLPAIWRMDTQKKLSDALGIHPSELFLELAAQIDGIVAKNMEVLTIAKTCREWSTLPVHLDYTAYAMNAFAIESWKKTGAASCTFPLELNKGELYQLGKNKVLPMELVIYGHMPMMVSAQCPIRNTKGCSRERAILRLKDRKGNEQYAINYCDTCYSAIYNSNALSYLDRKQEVLPLKPDSVRLQFSVEPAQEVKGIMDCFVAGYLGEEKEKQAQWPDTVTRGHWKRGVE